MSKQSPAEFAKTIKPDGSLYEEDRPWPVKIYTLGGFEMLLANKKAAFSRKVQQKPLDMLKAVISLGGENITEDQLTDALWPDADGDAGHGVFRTTLHRLRKLMGVEGAIIFKNGLVSLNERLVWVDAFAFERAVDDCDGAVKKNGSGAAIVNAAYKAVNMYNGHFLATDSQKAWTISMRERLRKKVLTVIGRAGAGLEENNDTRGAISLFQKGIEIDHLTEEFYRRLMNCHLKNGESSDAARVYNRLKGLLEAHLGVGPSPATNAVYKKILTNNGGNDSRGA